MPPCRADKNQIHVVSVSDDAISRFQLQGAQGKEKLPSLNTRSRQICDTLHPL